MQQRCSDRRKYSAMNGDPQLREKRRKKNDMEQNPNEMKVWNQFRTDIDLQNQRCSFSVY